MELDERVEILLKEFASQREAIMNMIKEVDALREKMDLLFPETIDARNRKFLEDKLKTMVSFYNVLLDMRKEISKSIKDELEIRRRAVDGEMGIEDIEDLLDLRDISKKIESFEKKKNKIQDQRLENHRGLEELAEKGIAVPGLKELKEVEKGD